MTVYERLIKTVVAERWDGTAAGLDRLIQWAGTHVIRGIDANPDDPAGPVLSFYCAKSDAVVQLRVGGAVAQELDLTGYYPIAPDVLESMFRPVAAAVDDAELSPVEGALSDDELEAALDKLAQS